ncbi:MAG: hypothetical protein JXA14_26175 [Anaerolineae bacterium]|nr:hypothetical protein [Anaerolineae bacterium]
MKPSNRLSLKVEYYTAEVGASLASVLSWLASWFAPVPEAVMTARAIGVIFEIGPLLSAIVAASIELVGMEINAHYMDVRGYNADLLAHQERYNARHTRLPLENAKAAGVAVWVFYAITSIIVIVTAIYEAAQSGEWLKLLAAAFPLVSALGTYTMNRRAAFHRRRVEIAEERPKREAAADAGRDVSTRKGNGAARETMESMSKHERILWLRRERPELTQASIAESAGCTEGYVSKVLSKSGQVEEVE